MAKITVHPGGFIRRNYVDELGLDVAELAEVLEVPESAMNRLLNEEADLLPQLAIKLSRVLGRSAESWMNMQVNYALARHQGELRDWMPARRVTPAGFAAPSEHSP